MVRATEHWSRSAACQLLMTAGFMVSLFISGAPSISPALTRNVFHAQHPDSCTCNPIPQAVCSYCFQMQKGSKETGEFSLIKLVFIPLLPEEREAHFSPSQPACACAMRNGLSGRDGGTSKPSRRTSWLRRKHKPQAEAICNLCSQGNTCCSAVVLQQQPIIFHNALRQAASSLSLKWEKRKMWVVHANVWHIGVWC